MTNSTTMESHPEIIDRKRQGQPFLAAEEEERPASRSEGKGEEREKRKREKRGFDSEESASARRKDFVLAIKKKWWIEDAQTNGR